MAVGRDGQALRPSVEHAACEDRCDHRRGHGPEAQAGGQRSMMLNHLGLVQNGHSAPDSMVTLSRNVLI